MRSVHQRLGRSLVLVTGLAVAALSAACGDDGPAGPGRDLEVNTLRIVVDGGLELDTVVKALGGFQSVATGEGEGIHVYAKPRDLPFAIQLPGRPSPGTYSVGRWDPSRDYLRENATLHVDPPGVTRVNGITLVEREPSVSFSGAVATRLGHYASVEGGTLELFEVELPNERANSVSREALGKVSGRLKTWAVVNSGLVEPGADVTADTIDITVEFRVELANWPDGRGTATIVGGALDGTSLPNLYGSGSFWQIGDEPHRRVVIGVSGVNAETGERVDLWIGTTLQGRGTVTLGAIDPWTVFPADPTAWSDHFAAVVVGGYEGERYGSVGGMVEFELFEPDGTGLWGEAKGRATIELERWPAEGVAGGERSTIEFGFHVPAGNLIRHCPDTGICNE